MLFTPDCDLDRLLAEDAAYGDLTTTVLGIGAVPGIMRFSARQPMVICATEEAARLLSRLGVDVELLAATGKVVAAGAPLLQARGSAAALLMGWKTAQTLVEWASGTASAVREMSLAASSARAGTVVACTRKTAPFTRALSVKAVQAGGGAIHRTGLGETVLLFPEHRAFLRDLDGAALVERLRARAPERKLMAEVGDVEEALDLARAGIDVLQLEKFPPEAVARVVGAMADLPRRPVLAAAGGVTVVNAARYAAAGADVLVTSAPYSAPPRDVQVVISAGGSAAALNPAGR